MKKKLLIFANGSNYIITPRIAIFPADIEPVEEIDLEEATDEEIEEIKKKLNDKNEIKKIKSKFAKSKNPT